MHLLLGIMFDLRSSVCLWYLEKHICVIRKSTHLYYQVRYTYVLPGKVYTYVTR